MRKIALAIVVLTVPVMVASSSLADGGQPTAHITRIGKQVYTPKTHINLVRHFNPTSTPTPSYVVRMIIPYEARHWGVSESWLHGRIRCETGGKFNYDAANSSSSARGLGQFLTTPHGGTWARALSVWSRAVTMRRSTSDLIRRRVVLLYSDGSRHIVRGRLVRRHVTIVRRGLLPRWPSAYHGWASVRATARAMAGVGKVGSGEWSCA